MITTLVAVGLMGFPKQAPGPLISKMLSHYDSAQTITGTIKLVAEAGRDKATVDTTVQFEKPSKVYLHQIKKSAAGSREYIVTSNGTTFTYNAPEGNKRLAEAVMRGNEIARVRDIYFITSSTIADKSPVLDCVFANPLDLQVLRQQWGKNIRVVGTEEIRGKTATIIEGQFMSGPQAPETDRYRMAITPEGDLLRYIIQQTMTLSDGEGRTLPVTYRVTWDADLKVNAPVNQDLFKIKR